MSTMNEALENVDYDQLNDWERGFYDDQKGKSYAPSPKQLAIINKMPKKMVQVIMKTNHLMIK